MSLCTPLTPRCKKSGGIWPSQLLWMRRPWCQDIGVLKTTGAILQIWYAALYGECRAGAQIIFPESGRALRQVTPTIFGIRSNISSKLLKLVTSNLVCGCVLPLLLDNRVCILFLLWGSTVSYPSDSWAFLLKCRWERFSPLVTDWKIVS